MSDNELGSFLRARRQEVRPEDVGLPAGDRRRTPGLRRAELATLAGVSVEYLTRLEQGRDRRPSSQVLGALADALRLAHDERLQLTIFAKAAGGDTFCVGAEPARTVRPTVQALLDRLEPTPAALVNRLSEILVCTEGYRRLADPIGLLDAEPPNLIRYVFTDPRARDAYPEWERVADGLVRTLRTDQPGADPHTTAMTEELAITAGGPFTERLNAPLTLPDRAGTERLSHPEAGTLRLAYETLELPDGEHQRLLVYLPADNATAEALDRLNGKRPGALRPVGTAAS